MDSVPAGDREAQITAIMDAIGQGGLFVVDTDIVPTQIGTCAHVMLPAATSGEANLTSMNGERRMRLTERYMDPPGERSARQPHRGPHRPGARAQLARCRQAGHRRQVQGL